MKRALLVGVDHYSQFRDLTGCANDVSALYPLLARNEDGSPNLECRLVQSRDASTPLRRDEFLEMLDELLAPGAEFALLYFAGHGAPAMSDVALVTTDGTAASPGVRFGEILEKISASPVNEIVVILDCCFSGGATTIAALNNGLASLRSGLSVLTASRNDQVSLETKDGRGQFSVYLEGALDAGAADVLGHVNVAGLYGYLSESFGAWEQRPTFKANVDRLHDLRLCAPRVALGTLRELPNWFGSSLVELPLDPSYEPDAEPDHAEHERIFAGLQALRACRLVEPIDEDHLYFAAMNSTGCRLTPLGRHYWHMAKEERI